MTAFRMKKKYCKISMKTNDNVAQIRAIGFLLFAFGPI